MKWFWNLKIKTEFIIVIFFTVLVSYRGDGRRKAESFEGVKEI